MLSESIKRTRRAVGEEMTAIRKKKRMTRVELAGRMGKSNVALYYWETGRNPITLDDLKLYCEILNEDWLSLLDRAQAKIHSDLSTPPIEYKKGCLFQQTPMIENSNARVFFTYII